MAKLQDDKDIKEAEDTAYKHEDDAVSLLNTSKTRERHRFTIPAHLRHAAHPSSKPKQILLTGLLRGLITWLLIGAFYAAIWGFKDRVLSPHSKSIFDAVTIGISIAFGLNIASALKANALDLRWWILSFEKRPSEEVELILHCDSMTKLLKLVMVAPRPRTVIVTVFWLAINIMAQVAIAVVAITYAANPGIADIYLESGEHKVWVPDLSRFTIQNKGPPTDLAFRESFGANVLGQAASNFNASALPKDSLKGKPYASYPAGYWNATDHWEYHFLDSAPSPIPGIQYLAVYSDRIVKSFGTCTVPSFEFEVDGQLAHIRPDNGPNVTFPNTGLGLESITYLTTPFNDKDKEDGQECGPGCANVKALEPFAGVPVDGSEPNESGTWFYDCNITVSADSADMPSIKAAQAAQAIALSGTIHPELAPPDDDISNQYNTYNLGLEFGTPQNKSATGMASLISRFAIGVVSAAAQMNPPKIKQGRLPAQGVRLQFESFFAFNLILLLTGSVQIVLLLATVFIASRMTIPDEAALSQQAFIRDSYVLQDSDVK